MFSHLPLDDQLNHVFYIDESLWRLVYSKSLGRCVLRQEAKHIDLDRAVTMIAAGELLWTPPETFERLGLGTSLDEVQQEHALLCAFLRSPGGCRLPRWGMRTRLEGRITDDRAWLARRALIRGEADENIDGE